MIGHLMNLNSLSLNFKNSLKNNNIKNFHLLENQLLLQRTSFK